MRVWGFVTAFVAIAFSLLQASTVGVAIAEPTLGRSPAGAVQLADEALHEAKAGGRNRVVMKGVDAHRALDTGIFSQPAGAWRDGTHS